MGGGDTPSPTPLTGPLWVQNEYSSTEQYKQWTAYGTRNSVNIWPLIRVPQGGSSSDYYYYFLNKQTQDAETITVGSCADGDGDTLESIVGETLFNLQGEKEALIVATYDTKPSDANIIAELSAVFG